MVFNNGKDEVYLETDVLDVGLRRCLQQERNGMQFPRNETPDNVALQPINIFGSKSLTSTEMWYSNIERETLGILHCLEKIQHYCFLAKSA